jgi:hypothetical protein
VQGKNNNPVADGESNKLNWLNIVPEAWAISVQVFTHRGFGERYLGPQAAAVILLVPCYCMLWQHADLRPMFLYLAAYLLMCLLARLGMGLRRWRGESPIHSRYCGYPRLMKLCPRLSEITVKRFIEPLLVFLGGVFTLHVSQPLGFYWMVAAACMCGQASQAEAWERMQATNMHDAVLDQQEVAERFRGMRGDDF